MILKQANVKLGREYNQYWRKEMNKKIKAKSYRNSRNHTNHNHTKKRVKCPVCLEEAEKRGKVDDVFLDV